MARAVLLLGMVAVLALAEDAGRPAAPAEPAGLRAPKYACLKFGAKAPRFVWMIWDGDVLYVDRDADGAFAPAERVAGVRGKRSAEFLEETFTFAVGTLGPWTGDVQVSISCYDPRYENDDPRLRSLVAALRTTVQPHVAYAYFTNAKGKTRRVLMTQFRKERDEAPVIHVDGPLTLGPVESLGVQTLWLGEENDFQVSLGTPGLGVGSFSFAMYDEFPKAPRPTAVMRFPGRDEPVTFKLKDKC